MKIVPLGWPLPKGLSAKKHRTLPHLDRAELRELQKRRDWALTSKGFFHGFPRPCRETNWLVSFNKPWS